MSENEYKKGTLGLKDIESIILKYIPEYELIVEGLS